MTSTAATSMSKSWAAIVKGAAATAASSPSVDTSKQRPLQPSTRGEKQSLCRGRVLVMLGHYGWIESLDDIDHPATAKNGGRIYVHKRDVIDVFDGQKLAEGDVVSFYLYVDDQGMGAEDCRLESKAAAAMKPQAIRTMSITATEFVPASKNGSAHDPSRNCDGDTSYCAPCFEQPAAFHMNPNASEFIPFEIRVSSSVAPPEASYPNLFLINPAFLYDSDDDEEASVFEGSEGCHKDSCTEKTFSPKDQSSPFALPLKMRGTSESGDSTSAGLVSDSEDECLSPPPGLGVPLAFSPPPGLSLPVGFLPPPGLC